MSRILDALEVIQRELTIVFPIHPRTKKNLDASELGKRMQNMPGLRLIDPAGYLDFLKLMSSAKVVLTDSGGIQEETTILGVPCLTLRENTERPVTIEMGGNRLVGSDTDAILSGYEDVKSGLVSPKGTPEMWDGGAAERIVGIMVAQLGG